MGHAGDFERGDFCLSQKNASGGGGQDAAAAVVRLGRWKKVSRQMRNRSRLIRGLHRAYADGTARGGGGMERRQFDHLDRHATALRNAERCGASALRIPDERVRLIVPDTGSGYGGKHLDVAGNGPAIMGAAAEAARLAKAAGKPVKPVWTRQEEFTWSYFRPAGVIDISSGVKKDGTLTAWEFHNYNSGNSALATPYEVPNQRVEFHPRKYPLKEGSYRGLAGTGIISRAKFTWMNSRTRSTWTRWNSG